MQKLIYIANIRLPTEKAHGIQIMKTCESLARTGVEVELVIPRRKNVLTEDPFEYYKTERNFSITRVWCIDFLQLKFFKLLSFILETVTFTLAARHYVNSKQSSVCYTRDLLPALFLPRPIFYEVHTMPGRTSLLHKRAWGRVKGVVVISEGIQKALMHEGVSEKKILIARDAVDPDQFQIKESKDECRNKLNLPLDQKIVLYTGHLYGWKGVHILAQTAPLLEKNIHVYLVGGTTEDIKKYKSKYTNHNLHIVGWRPHDEMPYWLKAADVLVIPTSAREKIGALYNSPLKLFEYMVSERPIVASDIPSLGEVVDEHSAFWFEPDNSASLAKTLNSVLSDTVESEKRSQQAYTIVHKEHTWVARARIIGQFIMQD